MLEQHQAPHTAVAADAVCNIVEAAAPGAGSGTAGSKSSCEQQQQLPRLPHAGAFALHGHDTVVTAAPYADQVVHPLVSQQHSLVPINDLDTPIAFDTPLFSGTALLLLRNMPNTPQGVFEGKRRQMVWTVQGRFKCEGVSYDSLVLGSDFTRPLNLPASPLLSYAISWVAARLGGGVSVDVGGKAPHIRAPLIAAAQVVNVALPGQQPSLHEPLEDMRLVEQGLVNSKTGQPLTAKRRRAHFSAAHNRAGQCFDTQHVWTFQMYEHVMDYSTFTLNVPLLKLDMVHVFDGQPLQLMLKDMCSGHPLLHLTVWHRRMLSHAANNKQKQQQEHTECIAAAAAGDGHT